MPLWPHLCLQCPGDINKDEDSCICLIRKGLYWKNCLLKIKRKLTIAKPTSAFFKAGPSLVPSPVTATTCLCSITVLSIIPRKVKHGYFGWNKKLMAKCIYMFIYTRNQKYLSLRCVCLWGKNEPVLVVWARSCQCVLVQSRNMRKKLY